MGVGVEWWRTSLAFPEERTDRSAYRRHGRNLVPAFVVRASWYGHDPAPGRDVRHDPPLVVVTLDVRGQAGAAEVRSFTVEARRARGGVTSTLVGEVPLSRLATWSLAAASLTRSRPGSGGADHHEWSQARPGRTRGTGAVPAVLVDDGVEWYPVTAPDVLSRAIDRSPRRRTITDEFLRTVAEVHRDAEARGRPPVLAVAAEFQTARPNAERWVRKARQAGYLPGVDEGSAR